VSIPRLRFAPSPTGYLHVGGARTALFNWLYVRRHGGVFVLRIEDTDVERSSDEMVTGILEGLRWLGLDWDEGPEVGGPHAPYLQSQRRDSYRVAAERLLAEGRAVTDEGAIRFKVPEGKTTFTDLVHGPIAFDNEHIEPFVILRSDGHPTYHLSVVVDDIDMAITHVVRGDDHISNTPKQVLLYQALGAVTPQFAHVPLIMGPDKKRLSKRHGATSVMEYERQGYTPEGMANFLALLGWSPGSSDEELFTMAQLTERFTLEGISGGNAVFNTEKLDWFNHQHLLRMSDADLVRRLEPLLRAAGLWRESLESTAFPWFRKVLALLRPRAKKLTEYVEGLRKENAKYRTKAGELGTAAKAAEKARLDSMGEAERKIEEAKAAGRTEAVGEFGKRLARTEFDAIAGRRNPDFDTASALEWVDLGRFVGDDGEPDAKAIKAAVERLVPESPNGPPSFDGGARTPAPPTNGMNGLIRRAAGRT
jgi:glutamyl/glutaminyl-tRNA synthetase